VANGAPGTAFDGLVAIRLATLPAACWVPLLGIGLLTWEYGCGGAPRAGSIASL
jgi:hypothetical protein